MLGFFSSVVHVLTKDRPLPPTPPQPPPRAPSRSQQQQQQQPPPSSSPQQTPPMKVTNPSVQPSSSGPRPAYPWSARRLQLQPGVYFPRPGVTPPSGPSSSPFPRYGHSLPPVTTASGELFLFGGLVQEQVKNDLYSFSTRDLSATYIETSGEVPPPRVGHASALVSSVLIVWGGDTKTRNSEKQDEGLYLLNLGKLEAP